MAPQDSLRTIIARAGALREAGAYGEAAAAYRAALDVHADMPSAWYNLGWLERRLGRPTEALRAYDAALRHRISGPEEVHLNRGVIYADDLSRPDLALAAYDAALALNPRYAPAHFNRGNLLEDIGQRAAALESYAAVLAIEPAHWEALSRLANAQQEPAALVPLAERIAAALMRNDLAAEERASLGFALGRARDLLADYPGAFAAYRAANEASRLAAPAPYDRGAHEALVAATMVSFARPVAAVKGAPPAPTIFICGMFRSGSTLLELALGGAPGVTSGGELPTLPAIAASIVGYPATVPLLDAARLDAFRRAYREEVARRHPEARVVTDKRPDNFLLIGLAKTLFPDAKILHTVRDPVDTCLATYFLHLDPGMAYARDLDDIAHWYGQYRRLMAHWKSVYPDDIIDFDYDRFVRAPRETLEPVLSFLGLDWDENCLEFHSRSSNVRTASVWQVREPLYQKSSGRGRKYGAVIDGLRAALRDYAAPES